MKKIHVMKKVSAVSDHVAFDRHLERLMTRRLRLGVFVVVVVVGGVVACLLALICARRKYMK